jgi:hypothetical protein
MADIATDIDLAQGHSLDEAELAANRMATWGAIKGPLMGFAVAIQKCHASHSRKAFMPGCQAWAAGWFACRQDEDLGFREIPAAVAAKRQMVSITDAGSNLDATFLGSQVPLFRNFRKIDRINLPLDEQRLGLGQLGIHHMGLHKMRLSWEKQDRPRQTQSLAG